MTAFRKHLWMAPVVVALLATVALLTTTRVALAEGPIYLDQDAPGPAHDGSSWASAYTDLQDALDAASIGDEIWVADGTYKPTSGAERTATFQMKSGVAIYGGFGGYGISETLRTERDWAANETILSGDIGAPGDSSDNSYHVVTGSGVPGSAVLDGFTISGGNADGADSHNNGGGMYNDAGSPTLANVTFSDNSATYYGGGMYNGAGSNATLTDVTFSGNSTDYHGGGMVNDNASPTLTGVTFSGNGAAVGGGGMHNVFGSSPTLTNVTFSGNSANNDGGGMHNWSNSSPTLTNVTFSGNSATNHGGGMYNGAGSNPALTNCILWGNTAGGGGPQIYNTSSSPTVAYSDIQGGCGAIPGNNCGGGNIDANPLFVDADGADDIPGTLDDDLHLQLTSPGIDAGDNTALPADTFDLDGDGDTSEPLPFDLDGLPRFVDVPFVADSGNGTPPVVDMGACEAQMHALYLPLVLKHH